MFGERKNSKVVVPPQHPAFLPSSVFADLYHRLPRPIGDLRALMDRLEIRYPSDLSGAVWEFINKIPRRPGQGYRPAAVKEHFDEKFFPQGVVNLVPLNAPGRRYQLR